MQFYVLSMRFIYASRILKQFHVVVLSDRQHLYIHKLESNESMLSRLIFHLKRVNFLFCSVYKSESVVSSENKCKIQRKSAKYNNDII